jgi:hypothetical protein
MMSGGLFENEKFRKARSVTREGTVSDAGRQREVSVNSTNSMTEMLKIILNGQGYIETKKSTYSSPLSLLRTKELGRSEMDLIFLILTRTICSGHDLRMALNSFGLEFR